MSNRRSRRSVLLGGSLLLLLSISTTSAQAAPHRVTLGCFDPACFAETSMDSALYMVTIAMWWFTRGLLVLARTLESLRTWLLDSVLGSAYGMFLNMLFPWVLIAGALAVLFFMASQALIAVMRKSFIDLRKAGMAGLTAVLLFSVGATGLSTAEHLRVMISQIAFFGGMTVVQRADAIRWYTTVSTSDGVPAPLSIYGTGSVTCPGMDLQRTMQTPTGATEPAPDALYMNDYVALYLYADAVDIHCPAPGQPLPAVFARGIQTPGATQPTNGFTGYFRETGDDFAGLFYTYKREAALILACIGVFRMFIGGILAVGAVLEQVLHLALMAALVSSFFGFAGSRLIAFFVPFEGLVSQQWKALISVVSNSFMAFFWIGIALGATNLATQSGSAQMTSLFALLTIAVIVWRLLAARTPLALAVTAASAMLEHAPVAAWRAGTGAVQAARSLATDAALVGAAVMTSGGSAVLAGGARAVGGKVGASTLGRAAGRHLGQRSAGAIRTVFAQREAVQQDTQAVRETNWWESRQYAGAGTLAGDLRADSRMGELDAERAERENQRNRVQIARFRRQGAWNKADEILKLYHTPAPTTRARRPVRSKRSQP